MSKIGCDEGYWKWGTWTRDGDDGGADGGADE